jgi:hypothetical protein
MLTRHLWEGQRNPREVPRNPGNDPGNQGNLQDISQNLEAHNPSGTKTHVKHQKPRKVATSFRQLLGHFDPCFIVTPICF